MDNENYLIPKHLDDPPMFLVWEADTAGIALMMIFAGLFTEQLMILGPFGLAMAYFYGKAKVDAGRGFVVEFVYWYTPSRILFKSRMHSDVRHYLG